MDQPAAAPSSQASAKRRGNCGACCSASGLRRQNPVRRRALLRRKQLQELVSPIALYPDVLVAQILAGSTYPTQVVEADRWA